jgi:purine-binding chemotaxis protein CheW
MAKQLARTESFILFEVAGTSYALRSTDVQQLEMLEHVTQIPNAQPFVDGIMFARGQVVPMVSLRARFGFPRTEADLRTRVIVVKANGRMVGLVVDSAREFASIPAENIQPPSEALTGLSGRFLEGIAKVGDRLILLLDLEQVLDNDGR